MPTTINVFHCSASVEFLLNAFENSDGVVGITAIVAPLHDTVLGIGSHNNYFQVVFLERKDVVVVLKEHDALLRHLVGKGIVF